MKARTRFMIRSWVGRSGPGYDLATKFLKMRKSGILLDDDTDLCIEGYPRCANTFAVLAFQSVQPVDCRISHHAHLAGHVIRAVQKGIPVIVLIREPLDAACSLHLREPTLSARDCLRLYVDFYKPLRNYLASIVVASFDQVTSHYDQVIRTVNQRFSTDYKVYENSRESDRQVMEQMRASPTMNESNMRISLPTEERRKLKEKVQGEFLSPKNKKILDQATRIFHEFMENVDE